MAFIVVLLFFVCIGESSKFDLDDLKRHVQYAGGYSAEHPVIKNLFVVLSEFNEKQMQAYDTFHFPNFVVFVCSSRIEFEYLKTSVIVHLITNNRRR